jgi:predicted porin
MIDGATRFGFNSSKDMGNGNTVSGEIEIGVDATNGGSNPVTRDTWIKFAGDWGSAGVGNQWSVMSSAFGTCNNSGASCSGVIAYQGRVSDSLIITGPAVGPLGLSVQLEADGSDLAAWALKTGIDLGALSIDAGYRDTDDNSLGVVGVSGTTAGIAWGASFSSDDTNDGNGLFANISGLKLQYDELEGVTDLNANYNIDLGGAVMRLIVDDREDAETKAAVQFNYSL